MRLTTTCGLLLALGLGGLAQGAEHKLDELRENVHPTKKSSSSSSSQSNSSDSSSSSSFDLSNPVTDAMFLGAAIAVGTVVWIPMVALNDHWDDGWDVSRPHQPQRLPPQIFSWDVLAAYQDDGDGVTHEWGRIRFDTAYRFGVTATLDHLREDGDQLMLSSADLSVRFAQGQGWEFHGGLGGQWLHDAELTDGGIHLSYGAEWWPINPLVLRAEVTCGTLGESGTGEAWGHVGAAYRWGEIFAGGRYHHIGTVEFAGPLVGAAVHW